MLVNVRIVYSRLACDRIRVGEKCHAKNVDIACKDGSDCAEGTGHDRDYSMPID